MNSFDTIPTNQLDYFPPQHDGYPDDLARDDTPEAVLDACGDSAVRSFPKSLWIEPRDWEAKARENDRLKTWPMNYSSRYTNQQPSHECTCHSLIQNAEACRNRQRGANFDDGPRKDYRYPQTSSIGTVFLSPMSVYPIANPGQWGGANVIQVLNIACKNGILPDKLQPAEYGFKHTIHGTSGQGNSNQSSGRWITERNFPDGWKSTAAWFRPLEVICPENYEQAVCLVLHGFMVSVGRNGHAIPWAQFLPGQGMAYPDSYNVTRYDSMSTVKRAWYGSFSIVSMTSPDDWSKPAG